MRSIQLCPRLFTLLFKSKLDLLQEFALPSCCWLPRPTFSFVPGRASSKVLFVVLMRCPWVVLGLLPACLGGLAVGHGTVPVWNGTVPVWHANATCEYVQVRGSMSLAGKGEVASVVVVVTAEPRDEKLLAASFSGVDLWMDSTLEGRALERQVRDARARAVVVESSRGRSSLAGCCGARTGTSCT